MDPLQGLWELYEAAQEKPQIMPDDTPAVQGMDKGNFDHPVTQQRTELDTLRMSGLSTGDAHEKVHGETQLSDVTMKADLSGTFGRVQDDKSRHNVHVDKEAEQPSLLSLDAEMEAQSMLNPESLKTKVSKQTPVETEEEYDYNLDVQYLQTYGRA